MVGVIVLYGTVAKSPKVIVPTPFRPGFDNVARAVLEDHRRLGSDRLAVIIRLLPVPCSAQ